MNDDARRRAEEKWDDPRHLAAVQVTLQCGLKHPQRTARACPECVADAVAAARREERERIKAWPHQCLMEACCIENGLAALRAGGSTEGKADAIMCTSPGKTAGSTCVLLDGHAGAHKFQTFRPLAEGNAEGGGG